MLTYAFSVPVTPAELGSIDAVGRSGEFQTLVELKKRNGVLVGVPPGDVVDGADGGVVVEEVVVVVEVAAGPPEPVVVSGPAGLETGAAGSTVGGGVADPVAVLPKADAALVWPPAREPGLPVLVGVDAFVRWAGADRLRARRDAGRWRAWWDL